jgi:hypothetical protein
MPPLRPTVSRSPWTSRLGRRAARCATTVHRHVSVFQMTPSATTSSVATAAFPRLSACALPPATTAAQHRRLRNQRLHRQHHQPARQHTHQHFNRRTTPQRKSQQRNLQTLPRELPPPHPQSLPHVHPPTPQRARRRLYLPTHQR